VPVYNSAGNLSRCLQSIRDQSYPPELVEVLCIDNGSKDNSFEVFQDEQGQPWRGSLHWLSTFHQGKPWALNVGVHHAIGEIVINIDSDVIIHPDAVANMVAAFESDPELRAATGAVEIEPVSRESGFKHLLHECEFQEYYFGFNVGRRFESREGALFTMAGAFSAFRRDTILTSRLYDASTVGEDTFMTFGIQQKYGGHSVRVVTTAVCYTEPIPGLRALYAQRVRWQRGEIEVMASYPKLIKRGIFHRGFSPMRTLLVDHTLAFPRVAWTFLLPSLAFFGYHWTTLATATVILYAAYVLVEAATWTTSALLVVEPSSRRILKGWWIIPLMPAYRYFVFWMRFAGTLTVLTEAHNWRTTDPVTASRREVASLFRHLPGRSEDSKAA
jgi:putative glycosyltransferase (exosortase G-associated)